MISMSYIRILTVFTKAIRRQEKPKVTRRNSHQESLVISQARDIKNRPKRIFWCNIEHLNVPRIDKICNEFLITGLVRVYFHYQRDLILQWNINFLKPNKVYRQMLVRRYKKELHNKVNQLYLFMMIYTNAVPLLVPKNDLNGVCNHNLCLIQELMHSDDSAGTKFKHVCTYFLTIGILPKSAMLGEIQFTFGHAYIDNKSIGETSATFALAGSLESMTVVSIDAKNAFSSSGKKISLAVIEVLLPISLGELSKSNNLRD